MLTGWHLNGRASGAADAKDLFIGKKHLLNEFLN